ncbi:MAG: FG-GAP-like repeat-containing protein [Acidobacteriota bacterium]|nr:FG-GAP-like repeat-containing protein [Acidobacteriota bacterium]
MPDGKLLVGGSFNIIGGHKTQSIARLNTDGSADTSFKVGAGANGAISNLFLLNDGKILVSGVFMQFDNQNRKNIVRLNSDGSLDTSFNPNFGTAAVQIVVVQADGKMIITGDFTQINGTSRNGIARLNADGTLDASFESGSGFSASPAIYRGLIQPDGKIILAGRFTSFNGTPRSSILRLNADGSLDIAFNPNSLGDYIEIFDIALAPDGKIYVAGDLLGNSDVYRLNPDGSKDAGFPTIDSFSGGRIYDVTVQPDGKVLIAGGIDGIAINGTLHLGRLVFRFNPNGSKDESFARQTAGTSGDARSLLVQDDGKILVGGDFLNLNGLNRGGISRLNPNGQNDSSFNSFIGKPSYPMVFYPSPDGKIYIGGSFDTLGANSRPYLGRVNADGSVDTTFSLDSRVDNPIYAIAVQPDGKILLGGYTNGFFQPPGRGLWRINPDGSLDSSFDVQLPALEAVRTIELQPDGRILIGGGFTAVNGSNRKGIARVHIDGSLDHTFNPVLGGSGISAIAVQPDGKILLGGSFGTVSGTNTQNIVRLNSNGTVDSSFNSGSGASSSVNAIELSPDGKIYIGGSFSSYNGVSTSAIARINNNGTLDTSFIARNITSTVSTINLYNNGKILVSGTASVIADASPRRFIIRLLNNGVVDYSFDSGNINHPETTPAIYQTALLPNGTVLAAGAFSNINNTERFGIAQLKDNQSIPAPIFDLDGDGKTDLSVFRPSNASWYRTNSFNNLFRGVKFGLSGDKIAPADFDGDYRTDIAVFRPNDGSWYILKSGDGSFYGLQFGIAEDIPVPGDYDGDGRADIAVFRPSNSTWYRLNSSDNQFVTFKWGTSGDKPLLGDFDGDRKADYAVFRPSSGAWYVLKSSDNSFSGTNFGLEEDIPVPADYDGDGRTDISVFRPTAGSWYRINSSTNQFFGQQFGIAEDKPVPADYDGDGRADLGVFRSTQGIWYIERSSSGFFARQFGTDGDVPAPSAFRQ